MNRAFAAVAAALLLSAALVHVARAQIGQVRRGGVATPEPAPAAPRPTGPPPLTDPNTVLLTVSVTGKDNTAVSGVSKERFQVLEDGVEQQVSYFYEDSTPITVGFVFDDSDRMGNTEAAGETKVDVLKQAAQSFLRNKNSADEYFLTQLSDLAKVTVSFANEPRLLPLTYIAHGATALYDGIYVSLDVIKEAANSRKFLLVITSGGDSCRPASAVLDGQPGCSDNFRSTSQEKLEAFAIKQPVQIYTIFVVDDIADADSEFVHRDATVLEDLATWTGGRMYVSPVSSRTVETYCAEIARGLKTQYLVGYKSTNAARDGKRRGVKVKVNPPEGAPKLSVWTKSGYYAPKDRG
jgi:Ca-activated chloride channel homolog